MLLERIKTTFLVYDGVGNQKAGGANERKIGMDIDWETIPDSIKDIVVNLLKNPPQLLRSGRRLADSQTTGETDGSPTIVDG